VKSENNYEYFSAACYFYARKIYTTLQGTVPLGLIATSYGGTIVEAWMSPDALQKCDRVPSEPALTPSLDTFANLLRKQQEQAETKAPSFKGPNRQSVLYNSMIFPLTLFGIKGAIWYVITIHSEVKH